MAKSCENCKRLIAPENYEVHTIYCKRNLQICPLCEEPVLKREQKEHFEEFHDEIDCVQCGKKLTRNDEASHLANECSKLQVPCKYCEMMLQRERLVDHEDFCGSRTDFCEKCCKYVLIKDYQSHVKICDGENPDLPCEFCGTLIPSDRLAIHQQQCFTGDRRVHIPLFAEDDDGIFREFAASSGSENSTELEDGPTGRKRRADGVSVSKEAADLQEEGRSSLSETNSVVALPCEVCGELCPADKLMEHQIECNQESESAGESSFRGRNQRGAECSGHDFEEFQHPQGFYHDIDASTFFEDRFFNLLHERISPFEMIRRSLFSRM